MPKIEIGTLEHAFRDEMSQIIHWSLLIAVSAVISLQVSLATAYEVAPVNKIFTYFM